MTEYRVLVCGGRDYRGDVAGVLSPLPITLLINGAAMGADRIAEDWARHNEINYLGVPAKWRGVGHKGAGPMRNSEMLKWEPDLLVAFPGGSGTANMVKQARAAGIPIVEVPQ